ncbi:MAG: amidohydrolase family protein [Phycisphaerales bacterium]|nr:MAG: amidohydrolase family protein [Phycisphaerales bacterium]
MMLKSRFVVPVDAPVIKNGAVVVEEGRISAVGPARDLPHGGVADYGDAVICPGFVNAHTHLELTSMAGRVPPSEDFAGWLRTLVEMIKTSLCTREDVQNSVRMGLSQSLAAGVTMVGDVTRQPVWTREVLAASSIRGVSFGEVIAVGWTRHRLAELLEIALSDTHQTDRIRAGVSPHAPYTVEPDALRTCAQQAKEIGALLCIHLAETRDEDLFLRKHEGPLADHLRRSGVWDDDMPLAECGPLELVSKTGVLGSSTVAAHANYVSDADIAQISNGGTSVAYCPRTHRAFGHPPHRFRDMLAVGINVCIGTDSLASNPSLSVLDELRFVRRMYPDCPPQTIMEMGTINGAKALGFGDAAGSITVGKHADLVVIPLEPAGLRSTWESILDGDAQPTEVYVEGVPQLGRKRTTL